MSDKNPGEGDRSGNLSVPLFGSDEKARQSLSQAVSSLFPVPQLPQMFPGALPPLALHPSLAAFQQIVNQQQRPSLFPSAAPFFGLPGFPSLPQPSPVGPSVFSPTPVVKPVQQTAPVPQQRSHLGSAPSPGLSGRSSQTHSGPNVVHSSSTPTVIVKQQQAIIGSSSSSGSNSQSQSMKVSSHGRHSSSSSGHGHMHSSDSKSRVQTTDVPPVVISPVVSNASGGVRLLAPSPYQMQQTGTGLSYPATMTPGGQPRLVPIQQSGGQGEATHSKSSAGGSSSVGRPTVVQGHSNSSSGSASAVRHSTSSHNSGASPVIPVVKISPAGSEQATMGQGGNSSTKISRAPDSRVNDSQSFHPSPGGGGVYYGQQSSVSNQNTQSNVNAAAMKSFSGQVPHASSRVPWSPLVHPTYSSHSRPAVPVGGGATVVTDSDMSGSGGQHGVSSRPGILRKRPAGEANAVNPNQNAQSPRRLTRMPVGSSVSSMPVSNNNAPQMVAYMPPAATVSGHSGNSSSGVSHNNQMSVNVASLVDAATHNFAPPGSLNRETSNSSSTGQLVKSESVESADQPPARKKPRKQQLLPRSGNDSLMTHFDPLNTISPLPTSVSTSTVPPASHQHRQHKSASAVNSSGASSVSSTSAQNASSNVKEEIDLTPEPELSEDDRKMTALVSGELSEFVDSDGIRWFSLKDNGRHGDSKKASAATRYNLSPAPKLSSFYRCTWRVRANHFDRYSDVRAKDERCPALSEFCQAARSHISREAAGWRVIQFLTLLDDQMAVESKMCDRITEVVDGYHGNGNDNGSKHTSSSNKDNGCDGNGFAVPSSTLATTPGNGTNKRGRGGSSNRLSAGGSAARQSARTRQQHQQQTTSSIDRAITVPFEYTQLPDMFTELNRRLKAVSNEVQSLYSAHVPIAHQLLDRYAPIKPFSSSKKRGSSCSSSSTSSSSSSSTGAESLPISPVPSSGAKDNGAKDGETSEQTVVQATHECLTAAVDTVSQQLLVEDKERASEEAIAPPAADNNEVVPMESSSSSPPNQQLSAVQMEQAVV